MIYVFCQGVNTKPSGGVKVLFDLIRAIKLANFNCSLLIPTGEYNVDWFDKEQIDIYNNIDNISKDDIVIIHEEALWAFNRVTRNGCKYIILNQGAHWSLTNYLGYERTKEIYKNALGIIVNSDYTGQLVTRMFGELPIERFHIGIDPMFKPEPIKKNKICYMSRRNVETAECVSQYTKGMHPNWECKDLNDLQYEQVAKELAESKIFLSFGGPEGFGMPPLEAALSGCKVIGYSGYGGDEFFDRPMFSKVPFMEIIEFINLIDHNVKLYNNINNIPLCKDIFELKDMYSPKTFNNDISKAINKFLFK